MPISIISLVWRYVNSSINTTHRTKGRRKTVMSNAIYATSKDIPDEMLLGNLLFMTTVDMKIPKTDFQNIFQANNIPVSFIRDISAADAFRRATSSVSGKYGSYKVEVDETRSDKDGIKKVVGIKTPDANDSIEYRPVVEILFDRDTETATAIKMTGNIRQGEEQTVDDITDTILNNFTEWKIFHTKETIVNTIKRIVKSMHPVNLMPTGLCKFIPKQYNSLATGLKEALSQLNAYRTNPCEANICEIIPVIDTDEQRNAISLSCQGEVKKELEDTVVELRDALSKKGSLTPKSIASYVERFKALSEKVDDYQQVLGTYRDVMKQQIMAAVQSVNNGCWSTPQGQDEEL